MKSIAITGTETCAYTEVDDCLYRLLSGIMGAGVKLVCPMRDAVDVTKFADMHGLAIEYLFSEDNDSLSMQLSDCECVVVFWDGSDPLSAQTANLSKRKGRQLRIHSIREKKERPPKRSVEALLTKKKTRADQ